MAAYTTRHMSGIEFELRNRRYEGDYTVTYTDESGAVLYSETVTRNRVTRIGCRKIVCACHDDGAWTPGS